MSPINELVFAWCRENGLVEPFTIVSMVSEPWGYSVEVAELHCHSRRACMKMGPNGERQLWEMQGNSRIGRATSSSSSSAAPSAAGPKSS